MAPTLSFEPTPVYYFDPPTSFVYRFKPQKQQQSLLSYFGPAIGVGLVFTFIFVRYWRKHMTGDDDDDSLFLDDEDDEDEEGGYDNVNDEESATKSNSVSEGSGSGDGSGDIALNRLSDISDDIYKACESDDSGDNDESAHYLNNANSWKNPIQQQDNSSCIASNNTKNMIPIFLDDSDHPNGDGLEHTY
jgi:hypothetical protein